MSEKPQSSHSPATQAGAKRRDLTRAKLVGAAIGLLNAGGMSALSIRSVADAVGVTPMAIYNHFESKGELLLAVTDEIVAGIDFDGGHKDWRPQILHCFTSLRRLCLLHPALPHLLEHYGTVPPSASAPMKVTLQALGRAGMSEIDALRTFFLLLGYTLSQAAYQSRPILKLDPSKIQADSIMEDLTTEGVSWDFERSFQFGLGIVLSGIEAVLEGGP